MTCIVGVVHNDRVYIGGDSAMAYGWEVRPSALKKVFAVDRFLIGYTTSFRMGQLLQYKLSVTPQRSGIDDLRYMVTEFAEAVRLCLKVGGFTRIEYNEECGGTFLVGYNGHLYCIYSDFQVNEVIDGADACGCGRDYALGALWQMPPMPGRNRVLRALSTAAHFSGAVVKPFTVLSVGKA